MNSNRVFAMRLPWKTEWIDRPEKQTMRVLILEPDPLQCDLLAMALRRNGYTPVICANADQVEDDLRLYNPDVLILDTHLPGHNGLDILLQLQETTFSRRIYVVMVSSLGFPRVIRQAMEAGADAYLVKPIDVDELAGRLNALTGQPSKRVLSAAWQNT